MPRTVVVELSIRRILCVVVVGQARKKTMVCWTIDARRTNQALLPILTGIARRASYASSARGTCGASRSRKTRRTIHAILGLFGHSVDESNPRIYTGRTRCPIGAGRAGYARRTDRPRFALFSCATWRTRNPVGTV